MNESVEFLLRHVNERFAEFRQSLSDFKFRLTLEDPEEKLKAADRLTDALTQLELSMSTKDHPPWVRPLAEGLRQYKLSRKNDAHAGSSILNLLIAHNPAIVNQTWSFNDGFKAAGIDFEAIYRQYLNASNVSKLFDDLVTQLETLATSGDVDSVQAIRALQKLIATIRKNSRGDLFSIRGSWDAANALVRNLFWEHLEDLPIVGPTVKALRKTVDELDIEITHVYEQSKQKAEAEARESVSKLGGQTIAQLPHINNSPE